MKVASKEKGRLEDKRYMRKPGVRSAQAGCEAEVDYKFEYFSQYYWQKSSWLILPRT